VAGALATLAGGARRPNVVLIVVDTLRADHLGCYGYARPTSPHLDALAARGARFEQVRATSSWTAASVASILSGLYPAVHGVQASATVLAESLTTVAEQLAAEGYATAGFSANAAFVTREQGFAQGFDEFQVLHGPPVLRTSTEDRIPIDPQFRRYAKVATADLVTDAGLAWLAGRRSSASPFLLYLHYFDPHAGYFPPPRHRARFGVPADAPLAGPAQWDFYMRFALGGGREDLPTFVALYDAEIAFVDEEIGRLLAGLERRRTGPTLVVVTSDHGEEFGEHGSLLHGFTLFAEQLRVPLIMAGPGVPAGKVVTASVSLAGLRATLGDLTHTPARDARPIQPSFAGLLHDRETASAPIFADLDSAGARHHHAVVSERWKLLTSPAAPALYDLETDPAEQTDLLGTEPERRAALTRLLEARNQAAARARVSPGTVPTSPLRRARLKALGYVE